MSNLSGADILGGVAIEIAGDMTGLRSTLSQAGTFVQTQAKVLGDTLKIKVTGDTTGLQATIAQATTMVQNAARAIATQAAIKVPINFDFAGLQAQAVQVRNIIDNAVYSKTGRNVTPMPFVGMAPGQMNASVADAQFRLTARANEQARGIAYDGSGRMVNAMPVVNPTSAALHESIARAARDLRNATARDSAEWERMEDSGAASGDSRSTRTGTGGGGSGGRRSGMNPFSERALARLTQHAFAVYGATAAMNLGSSLIEAQESTGSRALRDMSKVGEAHNVMEDPVMKAQANAIASIDRTKKTLDAFEAVPLAGAAVRFVAAMAGTTAHLDDMRKEAQRAVESHQFLQAVGDQHELRQAALSHNSVEMFKANAEQKLRPLLTEQSKVYEEAKDKYLTNGKKDWHGYDDAVRDVDDRVRAEMRISGQELKFVQAEQTGAIRSENSGRLTSLYGAAASQADYAKDPMEALSLRHSGQRETLSNAFKQKSINKSAEETAAIKSEGEAAMIALRQQQRVETQRAEEEHQAKLTEIQGSGQSARLRLAHQDFQAQLTDLDANNSATLARMTDGAEKRAKAEAMAVQKTETIVAHAQGINRDIRASYAGAVGANMRAERRNFEGDIYQSDAAAVESLSQIQDPYKRAAGYTEFLAQRNEKVQGRQREQMSVNNALDSRQAVAGLRMSGENERAGQRATLDRMFEEVRTAAPGEQAHVQAAVKAEMDAMNHDLTFVRGGDQAQIVRAGTVVGDPMGWSGKARELAQMKNDIAVQTRAVGNIVPGRAGDNIPNAPAMPTGGIDSAPMTLKEIRDLMKQLLDKATFGLV